MPRAKWVESPEVIAMLYSQGATMTAFHFFLGVLFTAVGFSMGSSFAKEHMGRDCPTPPRAIIRA